MSPVPAELMQQVLAAREQGGGAMATLLAEHPDPTVQMLGQLFALREQERQAEEAAPAEETAPAAPLIAVDDPDESRLRRRLERLGREVAHLRRVNDVLAAALGACPLCWGEEPDCDVCGGEGEPGWEAPDRHLFDRLVGPALTRVRPEPRGADGAPRPRPAVARLAEPTPTPERREQ